MFSRMSVKRPWLMAGVLLAVLAVIPAVARTASTPAPLVVNSSIGPATLDLLANACGLHDMWAGNFYSQLTQHPVKPGPTADAFGRPLKGLVVKLEDPTRVVAELASFAQSRNGRVFTLKINPNAKFNNGRAIDAAAVKASMERAQARASCPFYFWIAGQYDNIPKITIKDKQTLILRFGRGEAALLAGWATPPVSVFDPAEVKTKPDKKGVTVNQHWASNIAGGGGPYILDKYQPNKLMEMHRNPTYFGPKPLSEKIRVNFINSEASLLLQARSGKADVTFGLSPEAAKSLKNNPNVNVVQVPTYFHWNVNLNWKLAPLDKVKFREALTFAVPYQDILTKVQGGFGAIYYSPLAHNLPFFNKRISAPRAFDLAKAQALIKQSGVATPVDLELVVQQGSGVPERIATILQSVWKQIGINLTVRTLGPTEYNQTVEAHKAQMSIRLDGAGAPYPDWQLNYDMRCKSQFNLSDICIPEADKLLTQAQISTDPKEQKLLYDRIIRLWRAQSPKIVLFGINDIIVLNKRVKTYEWNHWTGLGLTGTGR